jgi:hypothetical protein
MITEVQQRAVRLINEWKRISASNLGAALWGNEVRKPQSYALPAGRLLGRMQQQGLVQKEYTDTHTLWVLTEKGKELL